MRSEAFSNDTRKMGFRLQLGAGALSLACNIFAGATLGERAYGVLVVSLFILAEIVSGRIQGRQVDEAVEAAAKRAAAAAKGSATRKANAAAKERLVKTGQRKMRKELDTILSA